MNLRLIVEHSPCPQPRGEFTLAAGEASVGRSADADWQIEDPEMYISRKHFIVEEGEDGFTVTDMSRGGLFVDGEEAPLGAGRSRGLRDGMRLRLGDVVLRVALGARPVRTPPPTPMASDLSRSFFEGFAEHPAEDPPPPRPPTLPPPFDVRQADGPAPERRAPSRDLDDEFTLDPPPGPSRVRERGPRDSEADSGLGSFFSESEPKVGPKVDPPPPLPPPPSAGTQAVAVSQPPAMPPAGPPPALTEALLKGLGLPPGQMRDFGPSEMEALGRHYRLLVEGLMMSLRSRAREKQNLRVAQTVIGSSDVNPLKFLPTAEEALSALLGPPRPGYLESDAAIAAAQRDLADHQVRSWLGLQASLRRMIDRFDPEAIERELEDAGRLRAILAGGRGALLWQLYRERFKATAKAAEDRFLGEVGGDFRDAYESKGRTGHDSQT